MNVCMCSLHHPNIACTAITTQPAVIARFVFCVLIVVQRTYSWAATGTPIQNSVQDFQALLQLIRLDPLMEPVWWKRCIADPLKKGDEKALEALRALIIACTIRRTKGTLKVGTQTQTQCSTKRARCEVHGVCVFF